MGGLVPNFGDGGALKKIWDQKFFKDVPSCTVFFAEQSR